MIYIYISAEWNTRLPPQKRNNEDKRSHWLPSLSLHWFTVTDSLVHAAKPSYIAIKRGNRAPTNLPLRRCLEVMASGNGGRLQRKPSSLNTRPKWGTQIPINNSHRQALPKSPQTPLERTDTEGRQLSSRARAGWQLALLTRACAYKDSRKKPFLCC